MVLNVLSIPPQGVRMQSVCASSAVELRDRHRGAGARVAFVVSPRRPRAVSQAPHLRLGGGGHRSGKRSRNVHAIQQHDSYS